MGYNQYSLSERSIYNLFSKYDKSLIDLIIDTFKRETKASNLLKKQFGVSFDGTNIITLNDMSYMEIYTLQGILTRFEDRLKAAKYLSESYTENEIYNMFISKNDIEISNMVKKILEEKEKVIIQDNFNNINQILNYYGITLEELKEVVSKIPSEKAKELFIQIYIEKNTNIEEICKKIEIAIQDRYSLLYTAKKYLYNSLENRKVEQKPQKQKTIIKLPKKDNKPLDREQYIKNQKELLEKTKSSKLENEKKESSKTKTITFYDKFLANYNKEQKEEIKVFIKEQIDSDDHEAIPIIKKMYTDTLTSRTDYVPTIKENMLVLDYKKKIQSRIVEYFKQQAKLKPSFYDYFIEPYMSETQKEEIKNLVRNKIKEVQTVDEDTVYKVYGEDLSTLNEKTTYHEAKRTRYAIKAIKKSIEKDKDPNQMKSSFYEYFIDDEMTNRDIRQLKDKVKELLQNIPNKELIIKMYTDSLDQYTSYNLSEEETDIFNSIKIKIKRELKKSSNVKEFKASFYDYFIPQNSTKEEEKEIKKQIDILLLEFSRQRLDFIYSIYSERLTELQVYNLEKGEEEKLKIIVSNLKNKLNSLIKKEIKKQETKKRISTKQRPKKQNDYSNIKSFYEYFINEETQEEKESIKSIIRYYIEKTSSRYILTLYKKFNMDLSIKPNIELSQEEKDDLKFLKHNIRVYIRSNSTINLQNNIYECILNKDALESKKESLRRYITYLKHDKKYIIFKIYGRSLNEYNLFVLSKEEKNDLKEIIKYLKNNFNFENQSKKFKQNFFDYFITDDMTSEEINVIKEKVIYYLSHAQEEGPKKTIYEIYGEKLDSYMYIPLDEKSIQNIRTFISTIKKKLEDGFEYKMRKSLIERYYSDDEVYNRKVELLIFRYFYLSSSSQQDNVFKLYGTLLNEYHPDLLTQEEKSKCKLSLLNPIKISITKKIKVYKDLSFISSFRIRQKINIDEEKELSIAKEYISKLDNKQKEVLYKVYGEKLDTINDIKITNEEKIILASIYKDIFTLISKERKTINQLKNSKELKQSYYDNFITSDMSKDDIRIKTAKIKLFIGRMIQKNKDIITKVYGPNYDSLNNIELTKKESLLLNRTIELVNNYLVRSDVEKKIEYYPNSFYDYFINDTMTEEEKTKIKEKVKYYYDCSDILAKDVVKKLYTDSLDYYTPSILDDSESLSLKRYIQSIKKYIEKKQTRKSNSFLNKSFYDYFMEEDKEVIMKVDDYLSKTRSYVKDIIIKIYGEKYDTLTGYIPTKEEKKDLMHFINQMKKSLGKETKVNKSFYDYFDEDKEKITKIINEQPDKYKESLIKLYGPNYDNRTNYKAEPMDYYYLKQLKKKINDSLNNKKQWSFNYYLPSFYDFFPSYQDEESKELIRTYIKYSESRGKKAVKKIYDDNLNYNNNKLDSEEKPSFRFFILCIKDYIKKSKENNIDLVNSTKEQERKARIQKNKQKKTSFYDYFIESDMTEEEIEFVKNIVKQYIDATKQSLKDVVVKAFGPNYDSYNDYKHTKEEKRVFHYLIQNIKRTKLSNKAKASSNKTDSNFKIDIYKLVPNAHLIMNNELLSINIVEELVNNGGIVDLYEVYYDSNKLLNKLGISTESLINIYLKYFDNFTDISEILSFIVKNTNDISVINTLLDKDIFSTLTSKEKEIIYLKLLQIKDASLTNEIIAQITGLTTEDISTYHILSKDDKINKLNKII